MEVCHFVVPKCGDIIWKRTNRGESERMNNKEKFKSENLNGAYGELASLIGIEAVLKIHAKYRGTSMFFPVELFNRKYISNQIVSEYDGHNIKKLATKYGYTEKWIRIIIKENLKEE